MRSCEYTIFMPMRPKRCLEPEAALERLKTISSSNFHLKPDLDELDQEISIRIDLIESSQISNKIKEHLPKYEDYFFKFGATFQIDEELEKETAEQWKNLGSPIVNERILIDISHDSFSTRFYDQIYLFNIVCNLAIPGISSINESPMLFIDNKPFTSMFIFSNEILEFFDEKIQLQKNLKTLDIEKTWKWAIKRTGFIDRGLTKTNVSRALAVFCQLFSYRPHSALYPEYFIWSILGIEALFADGPQGARHQIIEKSRILFNLTSKDLKKIKEMYNFRSLFFHGHMNLYNTHLIEDASPEVNHLSEKEYLNQRIAVLLFISSLQYCVENNIDPLEFTLALKGSMETKQKK